MKKYIVYVDDNFHHGNEEERYKLGEFDTCAEATSACRKIVDEYFEKLKEKKHTFKELWQGYTMYGDDPFIVSDDSECKFSAWDYAKKRCKEMAIEE